MLTGGCLSEQTLDPPELFDEPVVQLFLPFLLQKGLDCVAALEEQVPVVPFRVCRDSTDSASTLKERLLKKK